MDLRMIEGKFVDLEVFQNTYQIRVEPERRKKNGKGFGKAWVRVKTMLTKTLLSLIGGLS